MRQVLHFGGDQRTCSCKERIRCFIIEFMSLEDRVTPYLIPAGSERPVTKLKLDLGDLAPPTADSKAVMNSQCPRTLY